MRIGKTVRRNIKRNIDWKNPDEKRAYKRGWQRNLRAQCFTNHAHARAGEVANYRRLPADAFETKQRGYSDLLEKVTA